MSIGWLRQFGLDIVKGIEIVSGIEPFIQGALPAGVQGAIQTVSQDLSQVANIITQVEAADAAIEAAGATAGAPLTSAQKLAAATPGVTQVILQSTLLAGRTIENQAMFTSGVQQVINGLVAILNSLRANVATTSKT